MEATAKVFVPNFDNITSEKIILQIKSGEWQDIYKGLCSIKDNSMIIDYIFFRYFATKETYPIIQAIITFNIDTILKTSDIFNVYVNMKSLTISEVDKHKDFIQQITQMLKDRYPDKLSKCYIYNAPFIFSQVFNIISFFVDKPTLDKIELVSAY